eukprot:TRINITY_DN91201_c0_g1_i1.p1 TRINITY_DN91201_c0_g1~~TRINITY_DN91201_c0_g1_i1.p1  ORF type:complete len:494 (-),score=90.94 TRINITY_DN91201_c0_g1_i1:129-1610(-)
MSYRALAASSHSAMRRAACEAFRWPGSETVAVRRRQQGFVRSCGSRCRCHSTTQLQPVVVSSSHGSSGAACGHDMSTRHGATGLYRPGCSRSLSAVATPAQSAPPPESVWAAPVSDGSASLYEVDEETRAAVREMGALAPHPVSLQEVLSVLEPWRMAKFLQKEYPIRCAERILMIEAIDGWQRIDEFVDVHARHMRAFRDMRSAKRRPTLDEFTAVAEWIVNSNRDVVFLMARGVHRLVKESNGAIDSGYVDRFLDDWLLNRIGSNALLSQYLATINRTHGVTGIVDPEFDVVGKCEEVASTIVALTRRTVGRRPVIKVEAHSAAGNERVPYFPFIPVVLEYVMQELLKNSCRATAELVTSKEELHERQIKVVVCADERRVMINVSDRAGGIPFDVGQHVWSYLYTTAEKGKATQLAGYGVGLPLSRLYARYLGGSLNLVSLPGYGTHAYLYLPRLTSEQVEVVPANTKYRFTDEWRTPGSPKDLASTTFVL